MAIEKLPRNERRSQIEINRTKNNERQRVYRAKVAARKRNPAECIVIPPVSPELTTENDPKCAYSNRNTLGKAIAKTRRALPQEVDRQVIVVSNLIHTFDHETKKRILENAGMMKRIRPADLNIGFEQAVRAFYERDDISRVSPNSKDCRRIKNATGDKEIRQLRFLMFTLKEVHALFLEESRTTDENNNTGNLVANTNQQYNV